VAYASQAADFLADHATIRRVADLLAARLFDVPSGAIGHCIGPKGPSPDSTNAGAHKRAKTGQDCPDSRTRVSENTKVTFSAITIKLALPGSIELSLYSERQVHVQTTA
jgi:hypothetical protein